MTATTADLHNAGNDAAELRVPLPLRADTFLGVCEAIGEDLGFNANFLRIPLAAMILFAPLAAVGSYLGLGLVVALSRRLYPVRAKSSAPASTSAALPSNDQEQERLAA